MTFPTVLIYSFLSPPTSSTRNKFKFRPNRHHADIKMGFNFRMWTLQWSWTSRHGIPELRVQISSSLRPHPGKPFRVNSQCPPSPHSQQSGKFTAPNPGPITEQAPKPSTFPSAKKSYMPAITKATISHVRRRKDVSAYISYATPYFAKFNKKFISIVHFYRDS